MIICLLSLQLILLLRICLDILGIAYHQHILFATTDSYSSMLVFLIGNDN